MKKQKLTESLIHDYRCYLVDDEKSAATLDKYLRDVRSFYAFAGPKRLTKKLVLQYKERLGERYATRSANSMIAALNSFLRFIGRDDLCIKQFKLQQEVYCPEDRELTRQDYDALLAAAEADRNTRLSLILQTLGSTGIRISELSSITAKAVEKGEATVCCKGKTRKVFLVRALREKLLDYMRDQQITDGAVFVTRQGRPLDRSNVWHEMKALCKRANVNPQKVFPHNLRHLFARTFYGIDKDVVKLADLLGHSNLNTTRLYTITTGAEHRRRMEQMQLVV